MADSFYVVLKDLEKAMRDLYFFDIVAYDSIDNLALKEHIQKYGQLIYTRN